VENRFVEWGAAIADFDNDGWQDLMYMTGNVYPEVEQRFPRYPHKAPRVLFLNRGDGKFDQATGRGGSGLTTPRSSRGAAFGDFDNDGDVDVLVMNMNEPPSLLRNDYRGGNHWLTVELQGTTSNRLGLGATVRVTAGGRTQARAILSQSSYYSHDDLRAHFGLGSAAAADRIDVAWPNGRHDVVEHVAADRFVVVREGSGLAEPLPRDLTVENLEGAPIHPFASAASAWVFVFARTDCPVAARYAPELLRLQQRARSAHAAFELVFVDPDESAAAVRTYLHDYGYGDGALRDPAHRLVQFAGATTTPEAAVFVPSSGGPVLVYKGRIDDRYADIAHRRPAATRHDLDEVLTAIGEGRRPEFRSTPAVGCLIADVTR
jgi:hypothetical protein